MSHKIFSLVLWAMLFALCSSAGAQQAAKVPRLGYLSGGSSHTGTNPNAFWQGLREFGYVEGKNIRFEYGLAEQKLNRLPIVATQLVGLKVDIIVAVGGVEPALAAKKATKKSVAQAEAEVLLSLPHLAKERWMVVNDAGVEVNNFKSRSEAQAAAKVNGFKWADRSKAA